MKGFLELAVDRLAAELREDPSGAKSLAHVVAVVPTAQSGRRLRAALARRLGALVPPKVVLPDQLLLDPDDPRLADRADELIAFRTALGARAVSYDLPAQLADLRRSLAERQLTFADVAEHLKAHAESAAAAEAERWTWLAEIERGYFAALEKRGRRDRIELMKERAAAAEPPGEKVLRFDDLAAFAGAPATVPPANIHACGTAANEAWRIAEYFAAVKPDEALPALCVTDPELFPELQGAFEAKGLRLHNPASVRLATSSLGHLVRTLANLIRTGSYSVFSAFVRMGDVRRWIMEELRLTDYELTAALVDLDNRQAELLPEKIDDIAPKTEKRLRAIFEFVKVQLRKKGVRGVLHAVFRNRLLDEREESSREFAAAAECVNGLLDHADDMELFERLLDEATYNLEPDEGDVVLADGWLELPFLEAKEVVVAGFCEGRVPESVVGHPFLPDSLRRELGLVDNAARTLRDRAILSLALAGRPGAVHVCFHSVDARGDVVKPSRLLFETADDADLCARVRSFYGSHAGTEAGSAADLPRAWKLRLPVPPPREELLKISPTRLDSYLRCPFTYFLNRKDVLGDKRMDDRAEELASWEYGNLAHEALERWALSDLRDSTDAEAIRRFLSADVDRQLVERFGTSIPAIVAMQGESVRRRLATFAERQAEWREAGWKIVAAERKLEVLYDHTRFYGKCDRIDRNEQTGRWCVIDYKTWDKADKAESRTVKKDGTVEWKSLQLPLYCAMLAVNADPLFAEAKLENISSCYCVLGKTAADVRFTAPASGDLVREAEAKVRELVPLIERGIFWPPSPTCEWRYDFADWLYPTPEQSVDEDWIADQIKRKEESSDGS